MKNPRIKVGIIDSGFRIGEKINRNTIVYQKYIGIHEDNNNIMDDNGHGTCIVKILDNMCESCDFYIIKILDSKIQATNFQLIKALELIIQLDLDVINLSLGLENFKYFDQVKEICNKCFEKKIIIVCTNSNRNTESCLFNQEYVIKVIGGKNIKNNEIYYMNDIFYAKGVPRLLPWFHESYIVSGGNSFSVPIIVSEVVNCIKKGCNGYREVKDELIQLSKNNDLNPDWNNFQLVRDPIKNLDWYENIIAIASTYLNHPVENKDLFTIGLNNSNCKEFIDYICKCMGIKEKFDYTDFIYNDLCYIENLSNKLLELRMSTVSIEGQFTR